MQILQKEHFLLNSVSGRDIATVSIVYNLLDAISIMGYLDNQIIKNKLGGLYFDVTTVLYGIGYAGRM